MVKDTAATAATVAHRYGGNLNRMMLTAAGDQDTSASAYLHTHDGQPRVCVLAGSVLTYCTTYEAVAAYVIAWGNAMDLAVRSMLTPQAKIYDLPEAVRATYAVQLSQTVTGNPGWSVTPYSPLADPGRMASVWVRVGQLTVRALDLMAIDSTRRAWRDSLPMAAALFGIPPEIDAE